MTDAGGRKLLLDACVLIDFLQEDSETLRGAAQALGKIIIPSPVLLEVKRASLAECEALGLTVFEPELELVLRADSRSGGLSRQDTICLFAAQELNATLYTNDKPLINAASAAGVGAKWGLELLLELASVGEITTDEALEIAERICGRSSYYRRMLQGFYGALDAFLSGGGCER